MRIRWNILSRLWSSKAPWSIKRMAYQIYIQSAALSGLQSNVLGQVHYDKIDVVQKGMLRSMLCGRASGKGELGYKSWSTGDLQRYWRVAGIKLELRVRRIQWWQSLAREPLNNMQVVAALISDTELEKDQRNFQPTLNEEGRPSVHSNPRSRQMHQDFTMLAAFPSDDTFQFHAKWGGSLFEIFEETEANRAFTQIILR